MPEIDAPAAQQRAGAIATKVIKVLERAAAPGITGQALDTLAEETTRQEGGVPAFKGFQGFPATLCLSVNEQVVHGIPTDQPLVDGDLATLDVGVKVDGYYVDTAVTVAVGSVSPEAERLRVTAEEALALALTFARPDHTTGDLGAAVQAFVEERGFAVVRDCTGHGIGKKLHQDPSIPNFGKRGKGSRFKAGQAVAIEPIIVVGKPRLDMSDDHWTLATHDGSLAAHAEETVLITDGDPIRLTPVHDRLGALSGEKAGGRLSKATQTDESR